MKPDTKEKVIFPEDPEAAKLVTVELWQTRDGLLYGKDDEAIARRAGATHRHCEDCGAPVSLRRSPYVVCGDCRHKRDVKRWHELPRRPWDGTTPICIMHSDTFFFGEEDLADYCDVHGVQPNDLLLVHCRPSKPREIDAADYFCDELPEDGDESSLPQDIIDAVDALNEAIRKCPPLSWYEGKEAVDINSELA